MSSRGTGSKTADICDRHASSAEACEPIFEGYGAVAAFSGPISTVEVYEDNVLVREAPEDSRRAPYWWCGRRRFQALRSDR